MENNPIKVVMLGDSNVGKTTLVTRWITERFESSHVPTLGAAYTSVDIENLDGTITSLHLWDTAGQDQYVATTALYCRDAKGVMIVFDVTERTTFDSLPKWINVLQQNGNIPFIIAGNKADCQNRAVQNEEAIAFAQKYKADYFCTSAVSGYNVEDAFQSLASTAMEYSTNSQVIDLGGSVQRQAIVLQPPQKEAEKSKCCK